MHLYMYNTAVIIIIVLIGTFKPGDHHDTSIYNSETNGHKTTFDYGQTEQSE